MPHPEQENQMASMSEIANERVTLIAGARTLAENVKAAGRNFTVAELGTINSSLARVKAIDLEITQRKVGDELLANVGRLPDGHEEHYDSNGNVSSTNSAGQFLNLTSGGRKSLGQQVAAKMMRGSEMTGAKALLPSGEVSAAVELISNSPVSQGRVIPGLLSVLPIVQHAGPRYSYLRQTSRTNNAAPVESGGLKPTSVLGLTPITDDLHVVAHLSEPIDKYWLEDSAALQQFVADELLYGLNYALENQVINGDGTEANLTGLLNASGILVQPAIGDDLLGTFRSAVTAMETAGHNPALFVINPTDWERVETTKATGTGDYLIDSSPVDRAARKLWGVSVALSNAMAAGTGALVDTASVALDTDRAGIRVQWSENVGEDFSFNQTRARCEGRFGLSVYQGFGVVKITLPAAA